MMGRDLNDSVCMSGPLAPLMEAEPNRLMFPEAKGSGECNSQVRTGRSRDAIRSSRGV